MLTNNAPKLSFIQRYIHFFVLIILALLLIGCPVTEGTRSDSKYDELLNQAESAIRNNQSFNFSTIPLNALSSDQKYRYYQLKIKGTPASDVNSIIHDYIELEKYGSTMKRHQTINETWGYLSSLTSNEAAKITIYANEGVLQGWMDLLFTVNEASKEIPVPEPEVIEGLEDEVVQTPQIDPQAKLNRMKAAVEQWTRRYPNHPAALYLPRSIYGKDYVLSDSAVTGQVAIFIPQTGSSKVYGDSILMGFNDVSKYDPLIVNNALKVYNTDKADIAELAKQAQDEGATIIIGPLIKQDVQKIITTPVSVPVLALNKVDQTSSNTICYFALSPEDEASDAAVHIAKQQKQSPLLILPNNELGKRVGFAFIKSWKRQHPNTQSIPVQFFNSYADLQSQINSKRALPLSGTSMDVSNSTLIPGMASSNGEIDSIYIYSNTNEFILIKSLLDMNNSRVPQLFISSRANQANLSPDVKFDLEGVQIGDIPLLLDTEKYPNTLPNSVRNDYFLARLYAFGVDASRLANRYTSLANKESFAFSGLTGNISVSSNCNIQQSLSWATYQNGELKLVE